MRCECEYGMVRVGYRDATWEMAALLADNDNECRLAAVKAIGHSEADAGMALLKFKILCGDGDSDVAAECLAALPQIDAVKAIPFLGSFLESTDEQMAEAAALTLASTRRPEAFELLRAQWIARIDVPSREMLALAIATLRSEAAIAFLLAGLSTANASVATGGMRAVALSRGGGALRARV